MITSQKITKHAMTSLFSSKFAELLSSTMNPFERIQINYEPSNRFRQIVFPEP